MARTALRGGVVVPVDGTGRVIEQGAVLVEDG